MTQAGFYHCSVKNVGRANGRSIAAAAAYRSGERLEDERTGEIFDYRARGGVLESFIIAAHHAPDWVHDRHRLWSKAELAEQRANGRLATELELALPHELSAEQRKQMLKDFLAPIIAKHGVAADVAIHAPGKDGDHRNTHAHVLLTHRKLDENGFIEKAKGQRKDDGLSSFATGNGAAVSAALIEIRKEWEQHVNRAYERAGLDIRVDHRSHKERGIQQEPTKHLGPVASAMERRDEASDRGDINRQIEADNAALRERAAQEIAAVKAEADRAAAAQLAEMERAAAAPIYNDDDSRRRRKVASEREDAADPATIKRQIEAQQDSAAQAKEQTELSERFLASVRSAQEEGDRIKAAEAAAGQRAAQEDDIADPRSRYAQAAGERYDIRRPYSSLSEVVGLEGAMFQREQEKLKREAAIERDPEKRELIELRRQIEANDYMAVTSHRLAEMSKVITGNSRSEESQWQEQRSQNFAADALELRRQRQEAQDRMRERDEAREAETVNQARHASGPATGAAAEQDNKQPAPEATQEAAQAHEATHEPWMMQRGGAAGLSGEYRASAERSYERWSERNPELGQRHGFADYVGYVQGKWAEELRASQPAPEAAQEAAQAYDVARAASAPGQPDRPVSEAERPAEIVFSSPARPEPVTQAAAREITDARQAESASAENVEITDSKAARKAAWAQHRAETEQSIERGHERGHGHSR